MKGLKKVLPTALLPLLAAPFITFSGCAEGTVSSAGYNISNYFPLRERVQWKYLSTTVSERIWISVTGTKEFNGETVAVFKYEKVTYEAGGEEIVEPLREVYFSSSSTGGVLLHGYYDLEEDEEHIFVPPVTFGSSSMKVGTEVVTDTTHNGVQIQWTSKLLGVEDLEVTYGNFTGTLKLSITADGEDSPLEGSYWLFSDLGIVMWETLEGNLYELTDYSID